MKKIPLFIVLLLFWSVSGWAQRSLKYKNVYQILKTQSKEEAYMALQEFQHKNPKHANVYYQLGKITQYYSKLFDPMLYPSLVEYFTYETKNYLGLAKHYIDDKEVRRNRNFYEGVKILDGAKKISLIDVQHDVEQRISDNNDYAKNVKIISDYFKRSTFFYEKCIQNFRAINLSQPKIKDLYLIADDSLMNRLQQLKADFDSTLYSVTEYQNALTNYPLKNYHPEYTLKPIETYRLEGLTNVSFLYNLFYIWDFGKWISDFNQVLNKEIKPLRKKINNANSKLDIALKTLLTIKSHTDSLKMYHPADAVLNQIYKYDFASPIVALFQYKKAKIDFLLSAHNHLLDNNLDNSEIPNLTKAKQFKLLTDQYTDLTKKLKNIEQLASYKELNKYKQFIRKNYVNIQGFKDYLNMEEIENTRLINKFTNNYVILLNRERNRYFFRNKYLPFDKDSIALYNNRLDTNANFVSNCFLKWKNTQIVGGYFQSKKTSQKLGFVSALYKGTTAWTRSIKPDKKQNLHIQCISLGDNILYAVGQTQDKAYFVSIDGSGKTSSLFSKEMSDRILYFKYDDIAQSFLLITKSDSSEILQINRIGLVGEDLWQEPLSISLKGSFVDISKFGDNYYLLANAKGKFSIKDKKITFTKDNLWAPSILIFNNEGIVVKVKTMDLGQNTIALKSQKLNSALLYIIGSYGSPDKKNNKDFYILLDKELYTLKTI